MKLNTLKGLQKAARKANKLVQSSEAHVQFIKRTLQVAEERAQTLKYYQEKVEAALSQYLLGSDQ